MYRRLSVVSGLALPSVKRSTGRTHARLRNGDRSPSHGHGSAQNCLGRESFRVLSRKARAPCSSEWSAQGHTVVPRLLDPASNVIYQGASTGWLLSRRSALLLVTASIGVRPVVGAATLGYEKLIPIP
jgi:hypothetical protein